MARNHKVEALNQLVALVKAMADLDPKLVDMDVISLPDRKGPGCAMHHFDHETKELFRSMNNVREGMEREWAVGQMFTVSQDYPAGKAKGEAGQIEFCKRALPVIELIKAA